MLHVVVKVPSVPAVAVHAFRMKVGQLQRKVAINIFLLALVRLV